MSACLRSSTSRSESFHETGLCRRVLFGGMFRASPPVGTFRKSLFGAPLPLPTPRAALWRIVAMPLRSPRGLDDAGLVRAAKRSGLELVVPAYLVRDDGVGGADPTGVPE